MQFLLPRCTIEEISFYSATLLDVAFSYPLAEMIPLVSLRRTIKVKHVKLQDSKHGVGVMTETVMELAIVRVCAFRAPLLRLICKLA